MQKPLVLTLRISEDPKRAGAHEPIVFAQPIEVSKCKSKGLEGRNTNFFQLNMQIARASKHHPNSTADGKTKWTWDASAMDAYVKPTKALVLPTRPSPSQCFYLRDFVSTLFTCTLCGTATSGSES